VSNEFRVHAGSTAEISCRESPRRRASPDVGAALQDADASVALPRCGLSAATPTSKRAGTAGARLGSITQAARPSVVEKGAVDQRLATSAGFVIGWEAIA
jgi:hypothetical protein